MQVIKGRRIFEFVRVRAQNSFQIRSQVLLNSFARYSDHEPEYLRDIECALEE